MGACIFTFGGITLLNSQNCMYVLTYVANCAAKPLNLETLKLGLHKQLDQCSNLDNVKISGQDRGPSGHEKQGLSGCSEFIPDKKKWSK